MEHAFYLPPTDAERKIWLSNFNGKIPGAVATTFGITAGEVTQLDDDTKYLDFVIDQVTVWKNYWHGIVVYKDSLMEGSKAAIGPFPARPAIVVPAVPPVPAGVFPRVATLVNTIKKDKANYTDTIGKDLGIIGAEISVDFSKAKPIVHAHIKSDHAYFSWHKDHADAADVMIDLGDGNGPHLAGRFNKPHFLEAHLPALNVSAIYTVTVKYVVNDVQVGSWSDPIAITVKGVL